MYLLQKYVIGLVVKPRSILFGGETPRHFLGEFMKELSIFVDESGDFGEYQKHSPYYIVTMVFHDQTISLSANISTLNSYLIQQNYGKGQAIHTEQLIRREKPYQFFSPNERRNILSKLYYFALGCDIQYKTFLFHKKSFSNSTLLQSRMIKTFSQFFQENLSFFQQFERVILYYDNGQHQLQKILSTVLSSQLSNYEFRKVIPSDYRLFQVADLICTLELLNTKIESRPLSKSEEIIFHSKRDLKKDFIKGIRKKEYK